MPELPEVQAHCERLSAEFSGRVLTRFQPLSFSTLKTATPAPGDAVGRALSGFARRGKFLMMAFDGPEPLTFVIHLMQAGRLVPDTKQAAKPRGGMARWTFDDGSALLLTEAGKERKAGVWVMGGDPLESELLSGLGFDADVVTLEELTRALRATNQRVHGFLRDQHGIAGVGRLLANEICFRTQVSPFAMTTKLTDSQIQNLHNAIGEAISEALTFERSRDSMSKSADRPASVHHRSGETCPRCGDVIRSVSYNAYEVDYCATCQTDGKVLADNTTSRFLK
ncbi:MAG: DNA-formamidopyrimidine glycosylase family protein [Microthrixaceae bacterium]